MLNLRSLVLAGALVAVAAVTTPNPALSASPTFTGAQAVRGGSASQSKCQQCHGEILEGSDSGPPLAGPYFASQWGDAPVGDLFERVMTTMPAGKPGTLTPPETADIVAYVLCRNSVKPGGTALPSNRSVLDAKIPAASASPCEAK
jgi:mono/diheme cytochrome c family protein